MDVLFGFFLLFTGYVLAVTLVSVILHANCFLGYLKKRIQKQKETEL